MELFWKIVQLTLFFGAILSVLVWIFTCNGDPPEGDHSDI